MSYEGLLAEEDQVHRHDLELRSMLHVELESPQTCLGCCVAGTKALFSENA